MAVPARKTSRTRRDKRRTHDKLRVPGMTECDHCGELKSSHHVCRSCGTYKGRDIVKSS